MVSKNIKYQFDNDKLSFENINNNRGRKIFSILVNLLIVNFLGLFVFWLVNSFIGTPAEYLLVFKAKKTISKYANLSSEMDSLKKTFEKVHYKDDDLYRTILELDSLPYSIRNAGQGGHEIYSELRKNKGYFYKTNTKIDAFSGQLKIQQESYDLLLEKTLEREKKFACIPAIPPVDINKNIWITSYYGVRTDPFTNLFRRHKGIDFAGKKGEKIYATGDGVVTFCHFSRKGYGNEIVIGHGFNYSTRYAHLDKILVKPGQKVKRGELIGLMGNTGRSTGTHLHYEVRVNESTVNPIYYYSDEITSEEYNKIVGKDALIITRKN